MSVKEQIEELNSLIKKCREEEKPIPRGWIDALNFLKGQLKKEERAMYDSITVSCRGFTGTLEKLERVGQEKVGPCSIVAVYDISIKEIENAVTHVLENVEPSEIKLVSGRVTMG